MRNITVSVDDEIYRRARVRAAEMDTSVSALVRQFLNELGRKDESREAIREEFLALCKGIRNFSAADNVPRDELYDRRR